MAVSLYNAHLQVISIWTGHQHVHIVVGLQDDRISPGSVGHSLIGHTSQIRHDYKPVPVIINRIADSLCGIMRDDKMPDLHTAQSLAPRSGKHLPARGYVCGCEGMPCKGVVQLGSRIYGLAKLLAE